MESECWLLLPSSCRAPSRSLLDPCSAALLFAQGGYTHGWLHLVWLPSRQSVAVTRWRAEGQGRRRLGCFFLTSSGFSAQHWLCLPPSPCRLPLGSPNTFIAPTPWELRTTVAKNKKPEERYSKTKQGESIRKEGGDKPLKHHRSKVKTKKCAMVSRSSVTVPRTISFLFILVILLNEYISHSQPWL